MIPLPPLLSGRWKFPLWGGTRSFLERPTNGKVADKDCFVNLVNGSVNSIKYISIGN